MNEHLLSYIPMDRRHAICAGAALPARTNGAALFADVAGFTPLTTALVKELGPQRGAEELAHYLNLVYEALIEQLHRWRGSAIAFAGDAVTCWFQDDDGSRAVACALAMQDAMTRFQAVRTPAGSTHALSMKAAIATGIAQRWLVGDPQIRVIDVLAGATLVRLAAAEHVAERGEVILAPCGRASLDGLVTLGALRTGGDGAVYGVVTGLKEPPAPQPWPTVDPACFDEDTVRSWLLAPVYARLQRGLGEFLAELRPTTALFLRFGGIAYDEDPAAGARLDAFIRWVQTVVERYQGTLIDLNIGDKGSYLYINFGAPITHEDNAARAARTALELLRSPDVFDFLDPVQIGISQGRMRVGAYGAREHRTYGALGDEVNMAARLMMACQPGQILVSQAAQRSLASDFQCEELAPLRVKGKSEAVTVFALRGASRRETLHPAMHGRLDPMIGRGQELAVVAEKLALAAQGRGQIVGILGGAGIGKSRFVAEIVHMAYQRNFMVFGGECEVYGVNASYLVWQPIWRGLFQLDASWPNEHQVRWLHERLTAIKPALARRSPLLGAVLGLEMPDNDLTRSFDPKLRKASLEVLLTDCLRSLVKDQPTLLVLEECHWLDPMSHDLLVTVARAIEDLPVLIVLAYRQLDPERPQTARISTLSHHTEIELEALRAGQVDELARMRLMQLPGASSQREPSTKLVKRIVQQADGNPFYVEELVNFIHHEGIDPSDENAIDRLRLPASLQSLVLSRMDRLSEGDKTALKVASVVGRNFRAEWLPGAVPALGGLPEVLAGLRHLTEQGFTLPDPAEPQPTYTFKHPIIHSVVYESLLHALRTDLHEQIGAYIERTYGEQRQQYLDLLAYHFDQSENAEKRRFYLRWAGATAQATYANEAAIDYYRRVLPLLPPAEQVQVMRNLGEVEQLVGHWDHAVALFEAAIALAFDQGDPASVAWCETAAGEVFSNRGAFAEAADWLGRAEAGFRALNDRRGLGHLLHYSGTLAARRGDYATARECYQQSLAIRRALDDEPKIASLLSNLGILARFAGDYTEARKLYEEGLAIRRRLQDRWAIASSLNNLGLVARYEHKYDEARAYIEESVALFREVGAQWDLANTLHSLSEITLDMHDYAAAENCLRESLQINQTLGDKRTMAFILEGFAGVTAARQPERALCFAGAAAALRAAIGAPLSPAEAANLEHRLEAARRALSKPAAAAAWQAGHDMSLEAATEFALATR